MATDTPADAAVEFEALFADQDEATIRARWVAWANETTAPELEEQWTDTREGSFWHVATIGAVREAARIYDRMGTEVVMAGIPLWAFDTYLDDHAFVQDIERLPATPATGTVRFTGPEGTVIDPGTEVMVEPATDDGPAPSFQTTDGGTIPAPIDPATEGVLDLPVEAVEPGVEGNVSAWAISIVSSEGLPDVTVQNMTPTVGGTDPQSDEDLRGRLLAAYKPKGAGARPAYVKWALDYPGVGRVTVVTADDSGDANQVSVIVSTADGGSVSADVVEGFQAQLDPVPGKGEGLAPIGHFVTVSTATVMPFVVAGVVELEDGYSLDGAGGTIAVLGPITALVRSYVEAVQSGDEVVLKRVEGRITATPGVHDIKDVTLAADGGAPAAANVAVPDSPTPRVPALDSVDLTVGTVP